MILFAVIVMANVSFCRANVSLSSFVINSQYVENGTVYVNPATGREIFWGIELSRTILPGAGFVYENGECTFTLIMRTGEGDVDVSSPITVTESSWRDRGVVTINQTTLIPVRSYYGSLYLKLHRYNTQSQKWEDVYSGVNYPITNVQTGIPNGLKRWISLNYSFPSIPSTKIYPNNVIPALVVGQIIYSPNMIYSLTLQTDGNLVLYKNGTKALWWSTSNVNVGEKPKSLFFQKDGNLVLYKGVTFDTGSDWSSGRNDSAASLGTNAFYALQDDGNFVFYYTYQNGTTTMCYVLGSTGTQNGVSSHPVTFR